MIPQITELHGKGGDFHDSSLIAIDVTPDLNEITIVTSTPDASACEHLWEIRFYGVLRIEYEIVGSGEKSGNHPVEIYDIYIDRDSDEYQRWNQRARDRGIDGEIFHIVLASSFACGWGVNRERLQGITVICRSWKVEPAPRKFKGKEFHRLRIEGAQKKQ